MCSSRRCCLGQKPIVAHTAGFWGFSAAVLASEESCLHMQTLSQRLHLRLLPVLSDFCSTWKKCSGKSALTLIALLMVCSTFGAPLLPSSAIDHETFKEENFVTSAINGSLVDLNGRRLVRAVMKPRPGVLARCRSSTEYPFLTAWVTAALSS